MEFHQKRRQQFLGESHYRRQLPEFNVVISGPEGLEHNLRSPEIEPGWHASLARGVGFEKFNRLTLRYTAGESIESLRSEVEEIVAAYERYGEYLWKDQADPDEPVFALYSIDTYCQLMQLTALCYLLHRRDLLPRLARLQDGRERTNGGADWLFEEFMTYAPMERHESEHLFATKPYEALADALSSDDNDAALEDLHRYLTRWYKDLAGTGWHDSHKPNEAGEQGGYYGYWSFEAGAAVLLLGIEDDSSLHKYLYYPKDMVAWARVHQAPSSSDAREDMRLRCEAGQPCPRDGFWFTPAQPGSRRQFKDGEVMPEAKGDYGTTIWQWDEHQDPPKL